VQKEAEKTVRVKTLLTWGLVVGLAALFLLWWQGDALRRALALPVESGEPSDLPAIIDQEPTDPPDTGPMAGILTGVVNRWTEVSGAEPAWPSDFSVPQSCEQVEADMTTLCAAVDARARGRGAGSGFCRTLQQAGEELARRPPKPSSELRSYSTMLGNVFHLFRTLGKQRVELLRDVLNEEQAMQELASMTLFRWMLSRERCSEGRSDIKLESLYEYSAFLLQTMGGQAYLRRRGPHTESLATFYALLILDQAIEGNINPHGIDPRVELARCRGLLQSQPLVFRDRYLDILEEISQRWEARSTR
jgi:hypothetical protein